MQTTLSLVMAMAISGYCAATHEVAVEIDAYVSIAAMCLQPAHLCCVDVKRAHHL